MYLERGVQQIHPGKWAELEGLDQKFNAIESKNGFPAKRRYQCYIGGHTTDTLIIEREWESMAAMEAAYMKCFADTKWQALGEESKPIIESSQVEVYLVLS